MIEQLAFGIDLNIDPLWCAWFSGLVDGEGCLAIMYNRDKDTYRCHLRIQMRADELEWITSIQSTMHCGNVYITDSPSRNQHNRNENPKATFDVYRISDLIHIVIPILDRFSLRMKKQHDYKIWREAAMLIHSGAHLNSNRYRVFELKRMLSEVRKYKPPAELLQQSGNQRNPDCSHCRNDCDDDHLPQIDPLHLHLR